MKLKRLIVRMSTIYFSYQNYIKIRQRLKLQRHDQMFGVFHFSDIQCNFDLKNK